MLRGLQTWQALRQDPSFWDEFRSYYQYIGRPSACHVAPRMTEHAGGARIWLKREDLNHTGAHKINNAVGQALIAKRLGKKRLIAETGAGQHGVATATVCAYMGIDLTVWNAGVACRRAPRWAIRQHE
jgi:tryptophan synthase